MFLIGTVSTKNIVRKLTSKRVLIVKHGKTSDCIKLTTETLENIKKDQVLLKLYGAAVNPADINYIEGVYPAKYPNLPCKIGFEGSYLVEKVGEEVQDLSTNDLVVSPLEFIGSWSTKLIVNRNHLVKIPKSLSISLASTIKVNPITALRLLTDQVDLKPGDVVVQSGANSHLGQCVIQICHNRGIHTVNLIRDTIYSEQVKNDLKKLGASYVFCESELINKTFINLVNQKISKAKLAIDIVGGETTRLLLKCLENNGKFVCIGGMSKSSLKIPAKEIIFNGKQITGFMLFSWGNKNVEKLLSSLNEVVNLAEIGVLKEPIYTEFIKIDNVKDIYKLKSNSEPTKRRILIE